MKNETTNNNEELTLHDKYVENVHIPHVLPHTDKLDFLAHPHPKERFLDWLIPSKKTVFIGLIILGTIATYANEKITPAEMFAVKTLQRLGASDLANALPTLWKDGQLEKHHAKHSELSLEEYRLTCRGAYLQTVLGKTQLTLGTNHVSSWSRLSKRRIDIYADGTLRTCFHTRKQPNGLAINRRSLKIALDGLKIVAGVAVAIRTLGAVFSALLAP